MSVQSRRAKVEVEGGEGEGRGIWHRPHEKALGMKGKPKEVNDDESRAGTNKSRSAGIG